MHTHTAGAGFAGAGFRHLWRGAWLAGAICTAAPTSSAVPPGAMAPSSEVPASGSAPPAAADTPVAGSFPFAWRQLRAAGSELGRRDLLLQTGALAATAGLVSLRDDAWTSWMVEERPFGPDAYDIGYEIGHRRTQALLVALLAAGGAVAGRDEVRDTGLLMAQAHLAGAGLAQLLKGATDRRRPDGGDRVSLPSGHAVSAWTMAEVLQRRHGWWIGGPAFAAAIYTGASRVQGNRHHPSDVLAGFALAHWISAAVCRSVEPRAERAAGARWLPPSPGPGGMLVLVEARF